MIFCGGKCENSVYTLTALRHMLYNIDEVANPMLHGVCQHL